MEQARHNWIIGSKEPIESNRLFTATRARVRNPRNGMEREFIRLEMDPWVNTLALTPQQEILLVRQFRFGSQRLEWEVPGGVVEAGEDPVAAGIRELREECGFAGDSARILTTIYPNPAIQNNQLTIVLVENAVQVAEQQLDPMEDIEVGRMKMDEIIAMIKSGALHHSLTHTAIFHYLLQTGQLQQPER